MMEIEFIFSFWNVYNTWLEKLDVTQDMTLDQNNI